MADVNPESSKGGFVFGQNMEDRAIKPNEDTDQEDANGENNEPTGVSSTTGSTILKPSTFSGGASGGVIAPSKFQGGSNPWKTADSTESVVTSTESASGISSSNHMVSSSNPFAERVPQTSVSAPGSDSEADERKDKPVVAPSHFQPKRPLCAAPTFAGESASPAKYLLRPSALDKQTVHFKPFAAESSPKTSFKLEPAKLQSPLNLKNHACDSNKENEKTQQVDTTRPGLSDEANKRLFESTSASTESNTGGTSETVETVSQSNNGAASEKAGFVFGQNMGERVTAVASSNSSAFVFGEKLGDQAEKTDTDSPNNGAQPETSNSTANCTSPQRTLEESAAAEQAKQEIPSYEEVEVKTGEENESNVFQLNAKLYTFDNIKQNWCEKGRGALRLNDMKTPHDAAFQSRIVMRAQGSLRVILNTKVWAGQVIERANPKSVKISAWDYEEAAVKVFLIQANPKEADQIFSAIDWRIQQLKVQEQSKSEEKKEVVEPGTGDVNISMQKRRRDGEEITPPKKQRVDGEHRKVHHAEESNDSSTVDPETEASNESFASSPTVKSTSSDN